MIINIEQITEKGLILEYDQLPEQLPVVNEIAQTEACRFKKPIFYRLEAKRFGQIIDIQGAFDTQVQLACSRCLQLFTQRLQARFRVAFSQLGQDFQMDTEKEVVTELTVDELGTIPFRGDELDLSDALQEEIVMALPMQPLCSKTCKGLCPQCGADLNKGACGCRKSVVNSIFAVLKGLKLDQ